MRVTPLRTIIHRTLIQDTSIIKSLHDLTGKYTQGVQISIKPPLGFQSHSIRDMPFYVRQQIRPSVTRVLCIKTAERIIEIL